MVLNMHFYTFLETENLFFFAYFALSGVTGEAIGAFEMLKLIQHDISASSA